MDRQTRTASAQTWRRRAGLSGTRLFRCSRRAADAGSATRVARAAPGFRRLAACVALALALLAALSAPSAALADGIDDFLARNTCPVAAGLSAIAQAGRLADGVGKQAVGNRFIVVAPPDGGQRYVQCLFLEDDAGLLCEASSGFHGPRHGGVPLFRVSAGGLTELARLGFDVGATEGNFPRMLALPGDGNFVPAAELILRALHLGYGATVQSALEITAPLAGDASLYTECTPVG
ncbi:hypothetical protein [Nitratireductor pacificus]|uniref:TY-Chap N-terminal domain-containing protein n=1 Tax=Nitratireductor pacificus pht-3B TaxID=391937 RepID=K2LI45_9HYPH|nr:hypothetical protein [Nitratireductor pacificus]EKF17424.1 hypothetical protein NA2_17966 [Nitratireductor pacificus pht-3B]